MAPQQRVVAVVVTHNRRDLLVESLTAVERQTRVPDAVVAVDNASTDGTVDIVRERFPTVDLVALRRNTGGAGGFAVGIARALASGADLIWVMDDDTVAEPGALSALLEAHARFPGPQPPAVVASRVIWTDGRDHPVNTPREKVMVSRRERSAAATAGCNPIRSASFVSALLDADVVREQGLPVADYFLWCDDFEFTTRLLRGRRGLYCPASVVVHKTATFNAAETDPGERFFYEVRNKVWVFTRSGGLAPVERVLYGASTLRSWMRTFARSRDRAGLRHWLRLGLTAGCRSGPRSTESVLADLGLEGPTRQARTLTDRMPAPSRYGEGHG